MARTSASEPVLVAEEGALRSATEVATQLIRAAILDGRLAPGERLKEARLAKDLGISRTPIREALLVLQTEGLIQSIPHRGAVVTSYSKEELRDMYDLRAHLESYAARRAATRLTADEVAVLHDSCKQFSAARERADEEGLTRENLRFHNTIAEAAHHPKLVLYIRGSVEVPLVRRAFFLFSPEQVENSERMHLQITAALEDGDAERAELLMKEHVYQGRDFLMRSVDITRDGIQSGS